MHGYCDYILRSARLLNLVARKLAAQVIEVKEVLIKLAQFSSLQIQSRSTAYILLNYPT